MYLPIGSYIRTVSGSSLSAPGRSRGNLGPSQMGISKMLAISKTLDQSSFTSLQRTFSEMTSEKGNFIFSLFQATPTAICWIFLV